MKLHEDIKFFTNILRAASQHLDIKLEFVEKDYWITLVLSHLAKSKYVEASVFKGGTSLSKGFNLIERFSTDVDIAIINDSNKTGGEIKTIISGIEKAITRELTEIQMEAVTSKGSRFRKSVFEYPGTDKRNSDNRIMIEVNSFANPFPFQKRTIASFLFDFLTQTGNEKYINQYNLAPFEVNVLNKEQTLMEKLVSLIRASFDENTIESIAGKIRHFYDIYFLLIDAECGAFVKSGAFRKQFDAILEHDRLLFDEPVGWKGKAIADSPLIKDFETTWKHLKGIYTAQLSALAYTTIPDENKVALQLKKILKLIK